MPKEYDAYKQIAFEQAKNVMPIWRSSLQGKPPRRRGEGLRPYSGRQLAKQPRSYQIQWTRISKSTDYLRSRGGKTLHPGSTSFLSFSTSHPLYYREPR